MEKPKAKCAEIYHINSRLEIICTICSESYERIHNFCSHLIKKHFNLEDQDFLGNFLEKSEESAYQKLPLEIELNNDEKIEHHMENKINIGKFNCEDSSFNQDCENTNSKDNRNCERVQKNIDSIYLNVSSNEHVGSKDSLEKVDSDISDAYFQYVNTDFEKFGQEVDIFGETSARNILQNQCVSQSNSIMQPNDKEKNNKAETFVELECGNFYCTICGNKITKFNVKKHDHSRYKHQCNICYKLFISDISLSLHSRNYHKEHNALEKILCEICGESIFKSKLNYHLKLHDESRYLFQCDLCKKKFMSQNRLRNHTKVIHTKKFTSNKYKWIKKN